MDYGDDIRFWERAVAERLPARRQGELVEERAVALHRRLHEPVVRDHFDIGVEVLLAAEEPDADSATAPGR
jgi:hypothetical protein